MRTTRTPVQRDMKTKKFFVMAMVSVIAMCGTQAMAAETQAPAAPTAVEAQAPAPAEVSSRYYVNVDQYEVVRARTTDIYTKTFVAGESVVVYVDGDGDTDLDLYVYDENGNLIDSDTDSTDTCLCSFTPRWRGSFMIKVKNLGYTANCYRLRIVQ